MVDDPNTPGDNNSFDNFPENNFPGDGFEHDEFADDNSFNDSSFMEEDDFLAADRGIPGDLDSAPPKPNLKEIWDQNPSVKIFAGIAFVAVFLIAYLVFGANGDDKAENNSVVSQSGEVSQPPGTQELPPAYEEAVRQASEQRAESAANTGGSAIPTPIARPSERIEAPVQVEETDPLSEWRREAEERRNDREEIETGVRQNTTVPLLPETSPPGNNALGGGTAAPQNPPLPTGPTPDMVMSMSQQLQQQMQTIMETQIPKESVVVSMNIQPAYDAKKYFGDPAAQEQAANGTAAGAAAGQIPTTPPKAIINAGTIVYGQILTEANSDVPGPVLAEIASGPLLGGRAIGQFSVAQRHLVLQFNRVVKDGVEYIAQAYALDPATTLPGVATDIDRHYFSRVFMPAAARFIEGFASAATQTDNSVVVVDGSVVSNTNDLNTRQELLNGADQAAQELSSVLEEDFGNRPVTIKVAAGTRIGLLFLSAVYDPNAQTQQPFGQTPGGYGQQNPYGNGYAGQAYNAYNAYNNFANGNNGGYGQQQYYSPQQYQQYQQQNQQQSQQQQRQTTQQLYSTLRNSSFR